MARRLSPGSATVTPEEMRCLLESIFSVLWRDGNPHTEWNSSTISDIALLMHKSNLGPKGQTLVLSIDRKEKDK